MRKILCLYLLLFLFRFCSVFDYVKVGSVHMNMRFCDTKGHFFQYKNFHCKYSVTKIGPLSMIYTLGYINAILIEIFWE